jgi:hypothetical protein
MDNTIKRIIFVPRTEKDIRDHPDKKILGDALSLDNLKYGWGQNTTLWTLDNKEKQFDIGYGDQLYVIGGHGKPGSGVVYWGDENNWLPAETVAERTAARFPHFNTLPDADGGLSIKIYSCHSGEGGYNSFANRFARAFRPVGATYEVTIFGYSGAITPRPQKLGDHNIKTSKDIRGNRELFRKTDIAAGKKHDPTDYIPADYTGPKASVVPGAEHRWSKINPLMHHCRASEARNMVAWLKKEKGRVTQSWG